MFRITRGKGFHIDFDNGFGVSVQFGSCNYCDHYNADPLESKRLAEDGSKTAEVAVTLEGEGIVHIEQWGDSVRGYQTPEQVAALITEVSALNKKNSKIVFKSELLFDKEGA